MSKLTELFKLLRIHQWHKNTFVLLGFFVLGDYGNYSLLFKALVMTAAFCFMSSSVYIYNDYRDIERDRSHPVKKNRPLASGSMNIGTALLVAFLFCGASLGLSFFIGKIAMLIISLYLVNNLLYSFHLKKVPVIDVFQIGMGFMLRIFAGTAGIGIYISEWMIITGFMISLLIGFSKRYAELNCRETSHHHREVLQEYSLEILKTFVLVMASATIITYSLYTLSPRSVELHGSTNLIYTIPFVIFGIFRFLYMVLYHESGDDPSSQIFKDKQLVVTTILWAIAYSAIIFQ